MPELRDINQSFAVGNELAELCRAHEIGPDWIEDSESLDELLARVLDDCNRRLSDLPERVFESGMDSSQSPVDDDGLGRVRSLVAFARHAAELRERSGSAPSLVTGVEDLERLRRGAVAPAPRGPDPAVSRAVEVLGEVSTLCHQINNPLTSLLGRAQMLQLTRDPQPEQLAKAVIVIEESARRVAAGIQELGQLVCRAKEDLLSK